MPFLSLSSIRKMNSTEREAKLRELKVELSQIRTMIKAGGAIDNPSMVKELRRAIARVMTIQNEEKLKVDERQ